MQKKKKLEPTSLTYIHTHTHAHKQGNSHLIIWVNYPVIIKKFMHKSFGTRATQLSGLPLLQTFKEEEDKQVIHTQNFIC